MSMLDSGLQTRSGAPDGRQFAYETSPTDWLLFAGIMLALAGILNVIYGIAAIGDSSFFVNDTKYILSDLNTWGWIMLGLGALQIGAAMSTWKGGSSASGSASRSPASTPSAP
jgi:hypothetical protein